MIRIQKVLAVCVLFFLITGLSFSQQNIENADQDIVSKSEQNSNIEEETQKLLFKVSGDITKDSELLQNKFRKGLSVFVPIKANQRYAVVSLSQTLDTALRLNLNTQQVFKDLFLGENAGVLFTPNENDISENNAENNAVITVLSNISNSNNSNEAIGQYMVSVYELAAPPSITVESNLQEQELTSESARVGRITKEYAIDLEEGKRIYIHMNSKEFDTLLEFADRYGNTSVSDDWIQNEKTYSSLVTIAIPKNDTYFINATSFDGKVTGMFNMDMVITDNEEVLSQNDKITTENTKIFEKYVNEYPLSLETNEARAIELVALSGDIEALFTDANKSALYTQKIEEGKTVVFPVRAAEAGEYLVIVSSEAQSATSYSIKMYK